MKDIVVGIAEGKLVKSPGGLVTYALGSCVGVCLYDRDAGIAGMVHILLPYKNQALCNENNYKFADSGIRSLILRMEGEGASKKRLTAKIAGGAEMFPKGTVGNGIGQRNIKAVKETLVQEGIPVLADDTGENYGRTVYFSAESGKMTVKTHRAGKKEL